MNDFCETVEGPKRVAALQTAKKKRTKSEESTADPVFMFNRFSNLYPELRMDLIDERSKYATVRPIAFTRACILPRVQQTLASSAPESAPLQKLAELFGDLYENGDFDVRSILTMILLNGLDETAAKEKLVPLLSEELQKAYKAAPQAARQEGQARKGQEAAPRRRRGAAEYAGEKVRGRSCGGAARVRGGTAEAPLPETARFESAAWSFFPFGTAGTRRYRRNDGEKRLTERGGVCYDDTTSDGGSFLRPFRGRLKAPQRSQEAPVSRKFFRTTGGAVT